MKNQDYKDRADEHRGMDKYESRMKKSSGSSGIYKNEVSKPAQPKMHDLKPSDMGWKWVGDADEAAYGGAGMKGCREDQKKIQSQFKHYNWDWVCLYQ